MQYDTSAGNRPLEGRVPPFTHNVFISYSHVDAEWAQHVDAALKRSAAAYKTFFDEQSLRAGDDWDATIQAALEGSQHLVVLWSEQAKQSDWVTRELYSFIATAKPKVNANRRLVMLNLQGMNQAMKNFQQISRADLQAAYPTIGNMTAAAWTAVQRALEDGLNPMRRTVTVPLVVLTATLDELQKLSPQRQAWLQADFGLQAADLPGRYGNTRAHWRPFGGNDRIGVVLEQLRTQIDVDLGPYRFEWKHPDATFWSDPLAASDFVNKEFKTGELAVLVIDPVAVYEPDVVFQRLMLFHDCLASEKVNIVALPPFAAPSQLVKLRQALFARTIPYFTDYFHPQVPPVRKLLAQCGWNAVDSEDVRRLLVVAAGRLSTTQGETSSPFVRQG
jgi:hypothetical protein